MHVCASNGSGFGCEAIHQKRRVSGFCQLGMAVVPVVSSLSLQIAPPRLLAVRPSSSKTLKTLHAHHFFCQSRLFLKLPPSLSPIPIACSGYSSKPPFIKIAESDSPAVDGEENDESSKDKQETDRDQNSPPTLKTLMQVYKESILDGDKKTVSDIEAILCVVENEKNDMAQRVSELSSDLASGKDKFLRLKADFDNFRKRFEKDQLALTSDAQGEVIESLLPIVDSFERAKQHIRPESEKEKNIDTSYQGIYKQFVEIMRSLRVAVVGTIGKPFDPMLHEAIAREESQVYKEGIIIQEFRRGFVLGDRLLRPATVKVSSGPGPKKAPASSEKYKGQPAAAAAAGSDTGSGTNQ